MKREDALELIAKLPPGTDICVRAGSYMDDAYDAKIRVFQSSCGISAYFEPNYHGSGGHRNFPEGYSGVTEITKDVLVDEVPLEELMRREEERRKQREAKFLEKKAKSA